MKHLYCASIFSERERKNQESMRDLQKVILCMFNALMKFGK